MSMAVLTTNTATSPVTGTRTLNPQPINFAADWRIASEKPGEIVLTNITSPLAAPETLRIAYSEITDIFKASGLDAGQPGSNENPPNKKGVSVLVQLNTTVTDEEGDNIFPAACHIVFKLPVGADPTGSADVDVLIERLLGSLYDTKATDVASRAAALIHGSIQPADL